MSRTDARDVALEVLVGVENGAASDRRLDRVLRRLRPADRDRALATELVYGTLRRQQSLDTELARHSRRPLGELDAIVRVGLRLGAYQCLFLGGVPPHAAVDRAVEIVKHRHPAAAGFVNAVLRSLLRDREQVSSGWPDSAANPSARAGAGPRPRGGCDAEEMAARLDVPPWWARRWIERCGAEAAWPWLAAALEAAPLALRPHARRIDAAGLVAGLSSEGVGLAAGRQVPGAFHVVSGNPIGSRLMREGAFTLRSEASQLVASLLPLREGDLVWDTCAGRGGKSVQIAEDAKPRMVLATDLSAWRLDACRAAAGRARTPEVRPVVADLAASAPVRAGFDAVLVDAPCSGLGTVRRRPELKWRNDEARLERLALLQRRILAAAVSALAAGGRLLYVTCSTEPEENERVVEAVAAQHPAVDVRPPALPAGASRRLLGDDGYFRTYPHFPELDGFFAALLVKTRRAAHAIT